MKAKLSVLGVRGSFPVADRQFMEYGGNTSCLSLEQAHGEDILCFDAGSGLYSLRDRLSGVKRLHILISHVHIDHIMGLINLTSLKGPEIHLYGQGGGVCRNNGTGGNNRTGETKSPNGKGKNCGNSGTGENGWYNGSCGTNSFRQQLETIIGLPYWPVKLCDMGDIHIHELQDQSPFFLPGTNGSVRIRTLRGNHPGGSLFYRAEFDGISITYALDCELDDVMFSRLKEFAAGSSLLVWDANFVRADKRAGWGHSTWEEGLALGRAAGAERILMAHYSREYTDSFLKEQELLAREKDSACIFAREGMEIEL